MKSIITRTVVVACLVLTLCVALSWGQVQATNDTSDFHLNTGGGTGALENNSDYGSYNTAYGYYALNATTYGANNTAMSISALRSQHGGAVRGQRASIVSHHIRTLYTRCGD